MGEAKRKGDLLENVVALLHSHAAESVRVRVMLPVAGSQRQREIDVLLTSQVKGYPVQIVIECKNEKKRVGIERIDAFVGKLKDIGIPAVNGIYVSPTGYTKDALERAKTEGIRTLLFEGLTPDRLNIEISSAKHSIVFTLATWLGMNHFSYLPNICLKNLPGVTAQLDLQRHGHDKPGLMNLLWEQWITEKIPKTLGQHVMSVVLPAEYSIRGNSVGDQGQIVIIDYTVTGHMLQREGHARNLKLKNAETERIEAHRIDAAFKHNDTSESLICLESEDKLTEYLGSADFHIHGRIKVPRIVDSHTYWPPSERALIRIQELRKAGSAITFAEIEGTDLSRAWDAYFKTDSPK